MPGAWNRVQQRWPLAWLVVSGASTLVLLAGVLALALPVPTGVKLGPMVFLVTAAGLSMAANTENKRFAAPVVPLALMSGVAVLTEAPRRIWRGSIVVAVDAIKGEQPRERASGTPVPASRRS